MHAPHSVAWAATRAIVGLAADGWMSPHRHLGSLGHPEMVAMLVQAAPVERRQRMLEISGRARQAVARGGAAAIPDFDGDVGGGHLSGVVIDAAAVRLAHDATGAELADRRLEAMFSVLEASEGCWRIPGWLCSRAGAEEQRKTEALESVLLLAPLISSGTMRRIARQRPDAVVRATRIALRKMPRRTDRIIGLLGALVACRITTPVTTDGMPAFELLKQLVRQAVRRPQEADLPVRLLAPGALLVIAGVQPTVAGDLARRVMRSLIPQSWPKEPRTKSVIQSQWLKRFDGRSVMLEDDRIACRLAAAAMRVGRMHGDERSRIALGMLASQGVTARIRKLALRRMGGDPKISRTRVMLMAVAQLEDEASVSSAAFAAVRRLAGDTKARRMIVPKLATLAPAIAEPVVEWLAESDDRRESARLFGQLILRGDRELVLRFLLAADRAAAGGTAGGGDAVLTDLAGILRAFERRRRAARSATLRQGDRTPALPLPLPGALPDGPSRQLIRAAAVWLLIGSRSSVGRQAAAAPNATPIDLVRGSMLVLLLDLLVADPEAAGLRRMLVRRGVMQDRFRRSAAVRLLGESAVASDSPEAGEHDAAWRHLLQQAGVHPGRSIVRRMIEAEPDPGVLPLVVLGESIGVTLDVVQEIRTGLPMLKARDQFGLVCERDTLARTRVTEPSRAIAISRPTPAAVADLESLVGPRLTAQIGIGNDDGGDPELIMRPIYRMVSGALDWISDTATTLLGGTDVVVTRLRGPHEVGRAFMHAGTRRPVVAVTVNPILDRGLEGVPAVLGVGLHEIGHHRFDFTEPGAAEVFKRASRHPLTRTLLNLLLDERLERRLRSMGERYGRLLDRAVAHFIGRRRTSLPVLVLARAEGRRVTEVVADAVAGRYGGQLVRAVHGPGSPADQLCLSMSELMAIPGIASVEEQVLHAVRAGMPAERISSPRAATAVAMVRGSDLRTMTMVQIESLVEDLAREMGMDRARRRRIAMPAWVEVAVAAAAAGVGGAEPDVASAAGGDGGREGADGEAGATADDGAGDAGRGDRLWARVMAVAAAGPAAGPVAGPVAAESRTNWVGREDPEVTYEPLDSTLTVAFDAEKHRKLAEKVREPAASLRAALSRCGVLEAAVGGRRSGRFDRSRVRRWHRQPTASVCMGRERRVEPNLALALLIDRSGSMSSRIEVAQRFAAVVSEAARGLRGLNGFVAAFDCTTFHDLGDLRGDVAIASLTAMGGNNDAAALAEAAERLRLVPGARRVIVLISDGEPTKCSLAALKHVAASTERDGIWIVHVAIAPLRREALLPRHIDLSGERDLDRAVEWFSAVIELLATGRVRGAVGEMEFKGGG